MSSRGGFFCLFSIACYFVAKPLEETKASFKLHGLFSKGLILQILITIEDICWQDHANNVAGYLSFGFDFNQELKALVKKQIC